MNNTSKTTKEENQTNVEEYLNSRDYFWACTLTKDNPSAIWALEENEDEKDFLTHRLSLKQAVLGINSVNGERNVVEVQTINYSGEDVHVPIFSLTLGQNDSVSLDLFFDDGSPAEFRLVQGSGPVCLIGNESTELPQSASDAADLSQEDDSEVDEAVEESTEEQEEEEPVKNNAKKRKGQKLSNGKAKKGKLEDVDNDSDEEMDSEEEEEEYEEEEDNDEESEEPSSPEEKKKSKQAKKPQSKPKVAAKVKPSAAAKSKVVAADKKAKRTKK